MTYELSAALKEGKTLADLAAAAGAADGTISQEKADWLLEGLDNGFLDGPGFGPGGPHHGPARQPANQ